MPNDTVYQGRKNFWFSMCDKGLPPGSISETQFYLLIGISSIHSDRVILAMRDYLVDGCTRKEVCRKYQLNNGYFTTTIGRLIRLNTLVARIAHYYN
ncbi:TPA: adhesin biosynthesis transcription regulatory family protein [Escherichia coli]|nr:adhesin biosynthesis transcription regulatory family protein [Escherichia coli]